MAPSIWLDSRKTPPPDGMWCWVSNGSSVWIAMRDSERYGGWTNQDTWEDFDDDVKLYIPLVKPTPPKGDAL